MPTVSDSIHETGRPVATATLYLRPKLVETPHMLDAFAAATVRSKLAETTHWHDVATIYAYPLVRETPHWHDVSTAKYVAKPLLVDLGRWHDTPEPISRVLLADHVHIIGTPTPRPGARVAEVLRGHDAATPSAHVHWTLGETGRWHDVLSAIKRQTLVETTHWHDVSTFGAGVLLSLSETGRWHDTPTPGANPVLRLVETPHWHDAATPHVRTSTKIADTGFWRDLFTQNRADAWTANTDTWAPTRYTIPAFTGLAALANIKYGSTPTGLVVMGATRDAGAQIAGYVESALSELGSPNLKLAGTFNFSYYSEQPLTVTISTTTGGAEVSYAYTAAAQETAGTWVPGRVILGRGLRARFYRYRISNLAGGDFGVASATIDLDPSVRRV